MVELPTLRHMLEAGVHFGHKTSRWNPKANKFIFAAKSGIHVINLEKTQEELGRALEFLAQTVSEGKKIIFVGTKKQAAEIVKKAAIDAGMPYVTERWLGGLLTNFPVVQKSFKRLERAKLTSQSPEFEKMAKRDRVKLMKEIVKNERLVGGLIGLTEKPAALILIGVHDEMNALKEARNCGVITVGLADTNVDPTLVDYPVPGNDDATKSIELFAGIFSKVVKENKILAAKKTEETTQALAQEKNKVGN